MMVGGVPRASTGVVVKKKAEKKIATNKPRKEAAEKNFLNCCNLPLSIRRESVFNFLFLLH